jgi:hypothetical protein
VFAMWLVFTAVAVVSILVRGKEGIS